MTTENLKAVLTEEDRESFDKAAYPGELRPIIERLADEVVRLRKEVGLLREEWNGGEWEGHEPFDDYYIDALRDISKYKSKTSLVSWYAHMKREKDKRIQELEAQIRALKKLDDDNNADSVRRLKQMEEDKRTIKELQAKLKAWEDAPTITVMEGSFLAERWLAKPGVYHVKPKEADDAQGN
ncbi:MAG: hypothetical protein KC587_17505 [Nitrospira sp.]|nr:hypothetical protein [Nitrospira sp.]